MATQTSMTPLSNMELSSFCSQMSMILKSGISAVEGISIMIEDAQSQEEKTILSTIEEALGNTGNFCKSLDAAGVFPSYFIHMTDIGEQSGKLDEVMTSLGQHYEREADLSSAIKNAVTYPFIMIAMMMVVILVIIMKVLPIFNQVFEQLGSNVTGFSKGIMNLGTVLNRYSTALIVLLSAVVLLFFLFSYTAKGRMYFSKLIKALGLQKSFSQKMASCRFASGMALTLSSGLNLDQSLKLAATLVDDSTFEKKVQHCQELMDSGTDFSAALSETGIFSGIYARMVTIGFKTGALDEVMKKIAVQYETEIDNRLNRIISILEPTLIAVLSVVIGIILLSVMLPLMGIMSGF